MPLGWLLQVSALRVLIRSRRGDCAIENQGGGIHAQFIPGREPIRPETKLAAFATTLLYRGWRLFVQSHSHPYVMEIRSDGSKDSAAAMQVLWFQYEALLRPSAPGKAAKQHIGQSECFHAMAAEQVSQLWWWLQLLDY